MLNWIFCDFQTLCILFFFNFCHWYKRRFSSSNVSVWKKICPFSILTHFSEGICNTVFKNYSNCRIWVFKCWYFSPIFGIFNELLSTRNINLSRFARNIECDFLGDFQTLCIFLTYIDEDVHLLVLVGELQLFATFDRFIYEVELLQFFTNRSIVAVVRSHC